MLCPSPCQFNSVGLSLLFKYTLKKCSFRLFLHWLFVSNHSLSFLLFETFYCLSLQFMIWCQLVYSCFCQFMLTTRTSQNSVQCVINCSSLLQFKVSGVVCWSKPEFDQSKPNSEVKWTLVHTKCKLVLFRVIIPMDFFHFNRQGDLWVTFYGQWFKISWGESAVLVCGWVHIILLAGLTQGERS